jgi:flagellar biosynthesis/type III secretory pathway protein FliH
VSQRPDPIPLADRLWHSEAQPRPAEWMELRHPKCAPLAESLSQEIEAPDPLADPAVRARLDDARTAAATEAREAAAADIAAQLARLAESIARIDEARTQAVDMLASEIVELALVVAEGVCRRELEVDTAALVAIVEAGIASAAGDVDIKIKLHPDDVAAIAETVAEVDVKVVADGSLARGDCVIESSHRVI